MPPPIQSGNPEEDFSRNREFERLKRDEMLNQIEPAFWRDVVMQRCTTTDKQNDFDGRDDIVPQFTVARRVRDVVSCGDLRDITIRYRTPRSNWTEWQKMASGKAGYGSDLYCFAWWSSVWNEWREVVMLNTAALRDALVRFRGPVDNRDGSAFMWCPVDALPSDVVLYRQTFPDGLESMIAEKPICFPHVHDTPDTEGRVMCQRCGRFVGRLAP